MPNSEKLQFTIDIAQKAGEILLSYLHKSYEISYKEANERNIVTEADKASEEFLISEIHKKFPTHNILAEESGLTEKESTSEYQWIIDPLDGTNNFSHKYPFFAVSIGLKYKDEVIIGVVYAPFLKELFYAEKDQGAFLNNQKIKTSQRPKLNKSLLSTGFPPKNRERNAPYFLEMLQQGQGIRRGGAAAVDLCYIACGRIDGFWEFGLHPWDIAAASLIIQEAGGQATNIDGSKLDLHGKNILATNGIIHQEMQTALAEITQNPIPPL